MHIVFLRDELYELQRHHEGEDHSRDGEHNCLRKVVDHAVDTTVPCLGRHADLPSNLSDPVIDVIEQVAEVRGDGVDKQLSDPVVDPVCYHAAIPPLTALSRMGRESVLCWISRTVRRAGAPE